MSGYHRMSKLKNCIISLNNQKNLKKLNDNLNRKINSLCTKSDGIHGSTGYFNKIKEVNEVLTKEFNKLSANVRNKSNEVLGTVNENIENSKSKLKDGCKPLYTLSDTIEEKKLQYRRKHFKTRYIKKEAEKLCQYLSKRQVYGNTLVCGAVGLSLSEDPASTVVGVAKTAGALNYDFSATVSALETASRLATAAENRATKVFDTADHISTSIEAEKVLNSSNAPFAKVLERDIDAGLLSAANYSDDLMESSANVLDKNVDYFVVKTGKYGTLTEAIPEPPPIPDAAVEALNQVNALGEATFTSLGLGGWTPVGIVQQCMEYLHVTLGIDWWAAIALGTLFIRICMFPLVILAQRNSAKMHNYMPQMSMLQMKMTEARQTGDAINAARYGQEMMLFMNEKGLSPFKNMIVPLAQAPIFISFFMGLRQMANVPVDSLRHGGLFWFTDLTLPDQYLILPIVTSATLWLTIEIGTDAARLSSQNMLIMKYVLRAIPVIILPFTVNFPGVILCYWVSSNFISLAQVAFLRIPKVRTYFNIEQMIKHNPEDLPKRKGFREGLQESWTNVKITKQLEERRRLDEIQFQRAGKGPIQKTYKYDPTKQSNPSAQTPISAKKG